MWHLLGFTTAFDRTRPNAMIVAGRAVIVCWNGTRWCVVENRCPHRDVPLDEGAIIGNEVVCPLHAARFDLITGQFQNEPANANIQTFAVKLAGDELWSWFE